MKKYTTKESTKLKKAYKKDLESCKNMNELAWIKADICEDKNLTIDDQWDLFKEYDILKANFLIAGDTFRRATRPTCRKK